MRVLMLGWEFPPFITGGLGTACYGLTRAMSARGTRISFVLPKHVGGEYTSHVKMLSPQSRSAATGDRAPDAVASTFKTDPKPTPVDAQGKEAFRNVVFKAVPSHMASVYPGGGLQYSPTGTRKSEGIGFIHSKPAAAAEGANPHAADGDAAAAPPPTPDFDYSGDLFQQTRRYADLCLDLANGQSFDVIHAHDWLTFPAAQALSEATGKPWIAHVHSTEYDRAGEGANTQIAEYEKQGVLAADRVIAVSEFTRKILINRFGLDKDKCGVVYNGVERTVQNGVEKSKPVVPPAGIKKGEKVVLYLGRVTMQKGPEYFIAAAKKVLEKMDNVKFVVAGSGDQIERTIEQAAKAGIGSKITFTGFLRGADVARIYEMADVYVMPSVSEPFGIAPLEAIAHDVPVIISRQSGVSEVLEHALKVDFWDTHDIANKIIAVLRHPPLSKTMRKHADLEVRELTWDGAAAKCEAVYGELAGPA
ncbi:MAG: glycosyltransferase [Phycisphaeraceae bacterium]|nr:glycosyltransferase [Phycisphaeraceae bacterium]